MNPRHTIFLIFLVIGSSLYPQQFRFTRPVPDTVQNNGNYLYGEPNFQNPLLAHTGLDISIRNDTIRSASRGMVTFVGYNPNDTVGGYEPGGAGNYILVRSIWDNKLAYIYYFHLKKPISSLYDSVYPGTPVAISGNTGNSTGPHLHFEIRMFYSGYSYPRTRRNPELWFGIQGTGAIYGRVPDASNSTRVDIFPDPKPRPPYTTFSYGLTYNFNDTYIGSDDIYNENYAFGDVKPGTYTITANGGAYRRVVSVGAGQVVNADAAVGIETDVSEQKELIAEIYPNPFSSSFTLRYHAGDDEGNFSYVNISLYDLLGRRIAVLEDGVKAAGVNEINYRGKEEADGIYFLRIVNGNRAHILKLLKIPVNK
ncbi:MAG: peptidoglycan DD-metalloendopeptidase family protein [Ignavibacteriaceae bacterium]|nr:peptidoglycan DD-metalloendopeptidase family protein [Ignavibacteriaceae bacterium]